MLDIFYNEMFYWLLGTAVIFTFVGRYMSFRDHVHAITAATIDSLIEEKYLKTRGHGENMEILKYTEWCKRD